MAMTVANFTGAEAEEFRRAVGMRHSWECMKNLEGKIERTGKMEGPLLQDKSHILREENSSLPLQQMTTEERLISDYAGTGLTIGKHPMEYRRDALRRHRLSSAEELRTLKDGDYVKTAGMVIARQRPGTTMGFIFLSMEAWEFLNLSPASSIRQRERYSMTGEPTVFLNRDAKNSSGHTSAFRQHL